MADNNTTLATLKKIADDFIKERDWHQFHSPKNLSIDISVEAAELLEIFLWVNEADSKQIVQTKREAVEDEVADVLFGLLAFCNQTNIDLTTVFQRKMRKNAQKYPVDKARGRATKYTEF